jgi:hypothetical protein
MTKAYNYEGSYWYSGEREFPRVLKKAKEG